MAHNKKRRLHGSAGTAPQTPSEPRPFRVGSIGARGDGLGAPGPVYLPFTLPGEEVLARVQGERGELVEVSRPSPERVEPPCPHFFACGGCALQHWASGPYLGWKADLVRTAL